MRNLFFVIAILVCALPLTEILAADDTFAIERTAAQSTLSQASGAEDDPGSADRISGEVGIRTAKIQELDGLDVERIEKVPSNFGLWWRSVRETLSLALTWDDLDRAEKSLEFAEERMRIARLIAQQDPDDARAQEKARKMIDKAQSFLDKVEAKKDKWIADKDSEAVGKLVDDIVTHQGNSDIILDELETKLTADDSAAIADKRQEIAEKSQRLLNALSNENLSEEQKAHLEDIKTRIEDHLSEVRGYNAERKALMEKVKSGDESAAEELRALKEERQTRIQIRTEEIDEIKAGLEEEAAAGNADAQKKLDAINKIQAAREKIENKAKEDNQNQAGIGNGRATREEQAQAIANKIKEAAGERVQNGQNTQ